MSLIAEPARSHGGRILWRLLALACLLAWVLCLVMPAVRGCPAGRGDDPYGVLMAATGWLGPLIFQFGWFANPLFLIGVVWLMVAGRPSRITAGLGLAALALALTSLGLRDIPTDAPSPIRLCGFAPGFWVWVGAMAGLALPATGWLIWSARRGA